MTVGTLECSKTQALRKPQLKRIAARVGVVAHGGMISRRLVVASIPLTIAAPALAQPASFASFVEGVRAEARRAGIANAVLDRAFAGVQPNQKVIERSRHQPEFTMTWTQYRDLLVTPTRMQAGQAALGRSRALLGQVQQRYGVAPDVIMGIWGLESSFGEKMGDFRVVEALATLAWDSSRKSFFRSELIASLKILNSGDVSPARMTGSYAGAMGQPQFMPSSYLRYAVDFTGEGRRDIWTSVPDVLGSIANYLAASGWRAGETWGQQATVPAGFDAGMAGRDNKRPVGEWLRMGVRTFGPVRGGTGQQAALVLPDGVGGDAFLVYGNFAAIRRYNPSDFYALAVGLIGDGILA